MAFSKILPKPTKIVVSDNAILPNHKRNAFLEAALCVYYNFAN